MDIIFARLKGIGKILEWFPENEEPTFKFLLEKKCKKSKCINYHALLDRCDACNDWYHGMYAVFIRRLYNLSAKQTKKRTLCQMINSNER